MYRTYTFEHVRTAEKKSLAQCHESNARFSFSYKIRFLFYLTYLRSLYQALFTIYRRSF